MNRDTCVDKKFICAFLCLVPNDFKCPGPDPLMIEMSRQIKLVTLFFSKDKVIHMIKSYT